MAIDERMIDELFEEYRTPEEILGKDHAADAKEAAGMAPYARIRMGVTRMGRTRSPHASRSDGPSSAPTRSGVSGG